SSVTSEDVWLIEPEPVQAAPSPPPPQPAPPASTQTPGAATPQLRHAPLPASLVALLEEAELYLLPQWADYAEVARLVDQVEQAAPNHARVHEIRLQLEQAQRGSTDDISPLLTEAEECMRHQDYWDAVDLYEKALAKRPEDADALRGRDRARLLARWPAQLAAAGDDPD